MPNWLTKATGALSRQAEEEPQTFQVTCECREQHTGQRKSRPQRIICQTCGAALFVLPKNVYPPVKARAARSGSRKPKRVDGPPTGPGLPTAQEMAASVQQGVVGAASGISRGIGAAGRCCPSEDDLGDRRECASCLASSSRHFGLSSPASP